MPLQVIPPTGPTPTALAPSSLTDRARRNLTALATLDHIDQRGGVVTDHDRARLGLWTGWGALPQLFDPTVDREPFAGLRRDLEQRLNTAELRAASASTLNAHYTDPAVTATRPGGSCAGSLDGPGSPSGSVRTRCVTRSSPPRLDAGVPLRDAQEAASHADPRTTMRYDRARQSLDRHATYIVAASSPAPPADTRSRGRPPTGGLPRRDRSARDRAFCAPLVKS